MDRFTLRAFTADDRDWLVARHEEHYGREEGFDESFGPLVGDILDGFIAGHDPARETGWIAERDGRPIGSIFCVREAETTAKLRLFLLLPEARGKGLGRRLLETCMDFARSAGYRDMRLWTHESHRAACALYAANGWTLVSSVPVRSFGVPLVEQAWHVRL